MADDKDLYAVTPEHARWFGVIISEFARFETRLFIAVGGILDTDLGTSLILLGDVNLRQKIQTLRHLNSTLGIEGHVNPVIEDVLEEVGKLSTLRNWIAHCTWNEGRREGTIKPMIIGLRGEEIKLRGHEHNEPEFSLDYFKEEAEKLIATSSKLMNELCSTGLYDKVMVNMEETRAPDSERDG